MRRRRAAVRAPRPRRYRARPELGGQAQLAEGVSNSTLDEAVDAAMRATGAKITGAGGGGFVLVLCPVEHQESVRTALAPDEDLPIAIDPYGSRVIFNVHRNIWS